MPDMHHPHHVGVFGTRVDFLFELGMPLPLVLAVLEPDVLVVATWRTCGAGVLGVSGELSLGCRCGVWVVEVSDRRGLGA